MDCQQVRERLEGHLLDGLPSDERVAVRQHLAGCERCAEYAAELNEAIQVVREQPMPTAPRIPLRLRQMVRQEAAAQQRARARQQILRRVAAVAAVVLLAATGAWRWLREVPSPSVPSTDDRQARAPGEPLERPADLVRSDEPGHVLWQVSDTYASHESLTDTPVLVEERVFVLKRDAMERTRIMAVHARTGNVLWVSAETRVRKIAADRDRVYGLETDGPSQSLVVGLDAETGKLLWRSTLKTPTSPLSSSLVTAAGGVVVLAGRELRLLDGEGGATVWTRALDQKKCSAVAACEGEGVLVATPEELQCLDGARGALLWSQELTGKASRFARPCVAAYGGRCYVGRGLRNGAWELFCFQTREPKLLWKQAAPDATTHIAAGREVVLVRGRRIRRALAAGTGERIWEHPAEGCGPMSLAEGIVYYVDMAGEGALVACEARTGKSLWRERSVRSCSEVLVRGDLVYLNAHASRLYAFRAADFR